MDRIIYFHLYFFSLLFCSIVFSSCNEFEDEFKKEPHINEDVVISISTSDITTKGFDYKIFGRQFYYYLLQNGENIDIPDHACNGQLPNNLYLMILYEDGILTYLNLPYNGKVDDNSYVKKYTFISPNQREITFSFKKHLDPSKIEIILTTIPFQFEEGEPYISINNVHKNCLMMGKVRLAESSNWNSLNRQLTIKHLNSDFIILTTQENGNATKEHHTNFHIVPSKEVTPLIDFDSVGLTDNFYPDNEPERNKISSTSRYYLSKDISTINWFYYPLTSCTNWGKVIKNKYSSGYDAAILPKIEYDNKSYYLLSLFSCLGSYSNEFYSDGEKPRYLSILANEICHNSGYKCTNERYILKPTTNAFDEWAVYHIHWTSLPLPENGIKPNTRYIYILGDDYPLWKENNEVETRYKSNVQIIEQPMNEPLPFEFMEEE